LTVTLRPRAMRAVICNCIDTPKLFGRVFSQSLTSRYRIINILALEMVDQKAGGRSWRCVRSVNSLKAVRTALAVRKIKVHQAPCLYIISHHWFRHVAPANAFLEQHMLGAKVRGARYGSRQQQTRGPE
jgi:hypothetical protein